MALVRTLIWTLTKFLFSSGIYLGVGGGLSFIVRAFNGAAEEPLITIVRAIMLGFSIYLIGSVRDQIRPLK